MNINITRLLCGAAALAAIVLYGCTVSYSFSGASIHPDAKTVSIAYFPNNAPMVAPLLSPTFTDALQDRFQKQTKLSQVRENGDLSFEGEIVGYTSTPSAIGSSEGQEGAVKNRLTITVRVRFANALEPQWNFERNFSAYLDYDSSSLLSDVEGSLIPEIVDMLIDDIFNAAVANW